MSQRTYEISFVGLSSEKHDFEYRIEDEFFDNFVQPEFSGADIKVKLELVKKPSTLWLHFDIDGTVDTQCDRCGDDLKLRLWDEFDHIVKLVSDDQVKALNNEDGEVTYLSQNENTLDASKLIYEYIIFSLPLQKVHLDTDEGKSGCNEDVLNKLNEKKEHTSNEMWDKLKEKIETNKN